MTSYSADEFVERLPNGMSATVIVGKNGAGKTRLLVELSEQYVKKGRPVFAISNTPYDRFSQQRRLRNTTITASRTLPKKLILRAIGVTVEKSISSLRGIAETLRYCGYDAKFTVTVKAGEFATHLLRLHRDRTPLLTDIELREAVQTFFSDRENIAKDSNAISEKFKNIRLLLESLYNENGKIRRTIDLDSSDYQTARVYDITQLISIEDILRRLQFIRGFSVELSRNGMPIDLERASSGELSLLSTLVFLSTSLPNQAAILIDEPENSLHPQWQREYLTRLLDIMYYKQPTVIVATHAPLIVLGAQLEGELQVGIFEALNDRLKQVSGHIGDIERHSVEETLWNIFEVITPVSHFASQKLSIELEKVASGEAPVEDFYELLSDMKKSSFDPKQREFFDAVEGLAEKIERERDQSSDGGRDA